jgi:hypothetical protein
MNLEEYRRRAVPYTLSRKNYSKLFGIGYNKTGTTTLEYIFRALGLNVPNQQEQEIRLVKQMRSGNFQPLVEFVSKYDAFQDNPFSTGVTYAQVDALFPNSKFVLTVRDPEERYESLVRYLCKFHKVSSLAELTKDRLKKKNGYLYDGYLYENVRRSVFEVDGYSLVENWDGLFKRQNIVDIYVRRNEDIIKYFAERESDLLVIDLTKEADTSKIIEFLDLPSELVFKVPHLNSSK